MQNVLIDDRRIWVDLCVVEISFSIFYILTNRPISSQSVARMNTTWSNNPKRPRPGQHRKGDGYAGRDDLEETRKYRGSGTEQRGDGYQLVFDVPHDKGSERRRKRSRSSHREREERRKRSRSRERTRDRDRR